ncbi:unnamed protein product [Rangifer tarandus platyrhynchus]|uniref:Uncharacterized protein n=1 Tax=Rangifer tarandus platyrhynchus TaxID=3082113 RepID=A0AC60A9U0_RANTA
MADSPPPCRSLDFRDQGQSPPSPEGILVLLLAGARASSVPATMFLVGPGLDAVLRCLPSRACGTETLGGPDLGFSQAPRVSPSSSSLAPPLSADTRLTPRLLPGV